MSMSLVHASLYGECGTERAEYEVPRRIDFAYTYTYTYLHLHLPN